MTEAECSENLDLQKEIGVIFQPGGKGQVKLFIIGPSEMERNLLKERKITQRDLVLLALTHL